jgi:dolichyl-phosphate-mannose-protein mannosyltransferase
MIPPRRHIPLFLILALAAAIRLIIAPMGAHPGDLPVFMRWAAAMQAHGWLAAYTTSDANYPPLGLLLIAFSQHGHDLLMPGAPIGGAAWLILFKLPAILSDLLLIVLAARHRPESRWLWLSLALNPALILMSAWWGQLDSIYAALIAAALVAALHRQYFWSGVATGTALMVKQQAIFLAPIVAAAVLIPCVHFNGRSHTSGGIYFRAFHASLGIFLSITFPMLPFVLTDQFSIVSARLIALVSGPGWLTINALNFWYLVTGGSGNWGFNAPLLLPDTTSLLGPITYRSVGIIVLAAWMLTVLLLAYRARSNPRNWLLAAALIAIGIFLWPTQAHERYALAAVSLIALSGQIAQSGHRQQSSSINNLLFFLLKSDALYAMITITLTLNLLWAAPPVRWLDAAAGERGAGLIIAALMLLCALWGALLLAKSCTCTGRGIQADDAGSTTGNRSDAGPPGSGGGGSTSAEVSPP